MSLYGFCPQCGARGVRRERRMGGNDTCEAGHTYPTAESNSQPDKLIDRLTREIADLRAKLAEAEKDRDNELADNTGLALKCAALAEECDNFKALASRETSRRLAAEKSRDEQREAVGVLAEECALQREWRSRIIEYTMSYLNTKLTCNELDAWLIGGYGPTKERTNNNPTAAAAVKEAGK